MKFKLSVIAFWFSAILVASAEAPKRVQIDILSWLAGSWKGEAFGGVVEEMWSRPAAGSMMGMFRLIEKGKIAFSEFEQIVEHEGGLIFKVKHFRPDFVGWEEKEKFVEFKFLSSTENEVRFDGLTVTRIDADTCKHVIKLKDKASGESKDVEILYRRQAE